MKTVDSRARASFDYVAAFANVMDEIRPMAGYCSTSSSSSGEDDGSETWSL